MESQSTVEEKEHFLEERRLQENEAEKEQILTQCTKLPQSNELQDDFVYIKQVNTLLRQTIGSAGSLLISTCNGVILGFSAILFPQLMDENSDIKLTSDEASWIASMAPLQMASGCLIGGWAMEKFGRKPVNISASLLLIIGWTFVVFATTGNHILAGRLISGFSTGILGPSCVCYLGEITEPRLRGIFLAGITLGVAVGIFLVHLLGTFLDWKTVAIICTFIPIIQIITYSISPESYVWYVKKRRISEAKKSYYWFRGYSEEAEQELDAVLKTAETGVQAQIMFKDLLKECKKPIFYKPFIVLNVFFMGSQFCGNNAVSFYSVSLMQNTVPSLDKYSAMLIIDIVRMVVCIIACILTKKYRIRVLAMISGLGTAVSLMFLAVFSYLTEHNPENIIYSTIPIIGLISFIIFLSIGFAPLPWLICGEILPPTTKGIGSGISSSVNFLSMFIVVKTNPRMFVNCGVAGTYGIYGGLTLLATFILYFVLPETRNKTLQEIQSSFEIKSKEVINIVEK